MKHIQKLHLLLVTLMAKGFPSQSLIENKKLFADLKEFQGIIFDKQQRYGKGNYSPVPLEKDLEQVENSLAEAIYGQLVAIDITKLTVDELKELHKDYAIHCHHRKINYDGKIWKLQSEVRSQMLIKAEELQKAEERISIACFVINNSNSSNEEHKKAKELLKELDTAGCKF